MNPAQSKSTLSMGGGKKPLLLMLALILVLSVLFVWQRMVQIEDARQLRSQLIAAQLETMLALDTLRLSDVQLQTSLRSYYNSLPNNGRDITLQLRDQSDAVLYQLPRNGITPQTVDHRLPLTATSLETRASILAINVTATSALRQLTLRAIISLVLICGIAYLAFREMSWYQRNFRRSIEQTSETLLAFKNANYDSTIESIPMHEFHDLCAKINALGSELKRSKADADLHAANTTKELNEMLEAVEIQNVELDLARKRAEVSNEAKSSFLANISHEIRSPMNGVIGHLQLLQQLPLSKQQSAYINNSLMAANTLLGIIDDTLNLSRIEADRLNIQNQPFDLVEEVHRCIVMLVPSIGERDLDLYFLPDPDVPVRFLGDSLRIRQVMTNLISNAIKYTETGSVRVRIFASRIDDSKFEVTLEVEDTGLGMDSHQMDSLFEAFSQVGRSPESGTGLGLVITRSLTQAMGGTLDLVSHKGQGSTFSVRLPLTLESTETVRPRIEKTSGTSYVVSADPEAKAYVEGILTRHGVTLVDPEEPEVDHFVRVFTGQQLAAMSDEDMITRCQQQLTPHLLLLGTCNPDLIYRLNTLGACAALPLYGSHRAIHSLLALTEDSTESKRSNTGMFIRPPGIDHGTTTATDVAQFKNIHVLVADDDPIGRKYITELLQQHGATVQSCANGLQAIEEFDRQVFDLVLLDIRMPECDGIEATRRIRMLKGGRTLPIIGMTASMMPEQHQACVSAGMSDYWVKPLQIPQLISGLNHWLQSDFVSTTPSLASAQADAEMAIHQLDQEMRDELLFELKQYKEFFRQMRMPAPTLSALQHQAHRLNGSASICRLEKLRQYSSAVEDLTRAENHEMLAPGMDSLRREIDHLIGILEAKLARNQTSSGTE